MNTTVRRETLLLSILKSMVWVLLLLPTGSQTGSAVTWGSAEWDITTCTEYGVPGACWALLSQAQQLTSRVEIFKLSTSPGNILEMQILRPHPRNYRSDLGICSWAASLPRDRDADSQHHCSRRVPRFIGEGACLPLPRLHSLLYTSVGCLCILPSSVSLVSRWACQ